MTKDKKDKSWYKLVFGHEYMRNYFLQLGP